MVLHTVEDDDASSGSIDMSVHYAEVTPKVILIYLVFQKSLDRLFEGALNFTNTNGSRLPKHCTFEEEITKDI